MRYLAVGDIHGCFTALSTLAAFVPFKHEDVVVTLGDYVNRGPNSRAVLEWLIDYQRGGKLVPLRGNHELMMRLAFNNRHYNKIRNDCCILYVMLFNFITHCQNIRREVTSGVGWPE